MACFHSEEMASLLAAEMRALFATMNQPPRIGMPSSVQRALSHIVIIRALTVHPGKLQPLEHDERSLEQRCREEQLQRPRGEDQHGEGRGDDWERGVSHHTKKVGSETMCVVPRKD